MRIRFNFRSALRTIALSSIFISLMGCESTFFFTDDTDTSIDNSVVATSKVNQVTINEHFAYRADSRDTHATHSASSDLADAVVDTYEEPQARPRVEIYKRLTDYADQLAMSLIDRAFTLKKSDKLAVASFVRFDKTLRQPTVLGNRLAEALMTELQTFGVTVVDTKLSRNLAITPQGDLALSRSKMDLASSLNVDYIVTGTLIERPNGVEVNARIIGVENQTVAATSNLFIPDFVVANESYYSARF